MKPIYSRTGLSRLDEIVQPGLLCAFDFDGTLSPIARHPQQAILPPEVLRRLIELSNHAPVAIITGRTMADIRVRLKHESALNFEPTYLVGNHGLEGLPEGGSYTAQYADICRIWSATLLGWLEKQPHLQHDIHLENKEYSLSVHYRLARDRKQAERQLMELCARLDPLPRIIAGKCVLNLLPHGAPNKGAALEKLMEMSGAPAAIYVGDDITDEDVFKLQREDLLSVRVEPAIESAAVYFLNQQIEIVQLLDELIRRLHQFDRTPATPEACHRTECPSRLTQLEARASTEE